MPDEKPCPHTPPVKRNLNSELSCLQPFQSHCSWHAGPEPRPSQCRPSHPGSRALLHLRRGLSVELPMNATALNPMAPASTTAVTSAATQGQSCCVSWGTGGDKCSRPVFNRQLSTRWHSVVQYYLGEVQIELHLSDNLSFQSLSFRLTAHHVPFSSPCENYSFLRRGPKTCVFCTCTPLPVWGRVGAGGPGRGSSPSRAHTETVQTKWSQKYQSHYRYTGPPPTSLLTPRK